MRNWAIFVLCNALAYVLVAVLYVSFSLSLPVGSSRSLPEVTRGIPIVVPTCTKYMADAKLCKARLENQLGLENVQILNGDDSEWDENVYFKSVNFKAVCNYMVEHKIPFMLYFEEDAVAYTDRLLRVRFRKMAELISWGKDPG